MTEITLKIEKLTKNTPKTRKDKNYPKTCKRIKMITPKLQNDQNALNSSRMRKIDPETSKMVKIPQNL